MLDSETLARHLAALGWSAALHGPKTFRSLHETAEGEVCVFLRITENWLVASVVPFLPTKGDISFELSRWLLRQSRDMQQAKFAYDEDGDVVLTVELPTESLDFSELRTALDELLRQTVRHRATLREAAEASRA
jgi:hypothetical protein